MNRRIAMLGAGTVAAAALVVAGLTTANDPTPKADKSPTATVASTPPLAATPANDYKIAPTGSVSSFTVKLGKQEGNATYVVTFKRGKLTKQSNANSLTASTLPMPTGALSNGAGTVLGSACDMSQDDVAFPFVLSVKTGKTSISHINVDIHAYLPFGKNKEGGVFPNSAQIEYTGSNSKPQCAPMTRYNGTTPLTNGFDFAYSRNELAITGWIILRTQALVAENQLAVTSDTQYSGMAANTVTNVNGEFSPYKVNTINGRGRVTAGGTMSLQPNK